MDSSIHIHDPDVRPLSGIRFNILRNDEVRKISALGRDTTGIDIPDLYDQMEPKRNGLIDPRMGVTSSNQECATCGLSSMDCVGHFGHIDLVEPVFNMGYIQYVKKILSCVCLRCSKLLVYKNELDLLEALKGKSEKARFAEIRNIAKGVSYCQQPDYGCGTPVTKIKLDIKKTTGAINIISESTVPGENEGDVKKKLRHILTPDDCYNILKNISNIDSMILGMDPKQSRPEEMIIKVFPVSPVAVRPSAKVDFMESSVKEDDLTHKYADILKANIRIRKYKESSNDTTARYSQDHIHLLQYHVATLYDNETTSLPKSEQRNKPSTSMVKRLKGKEGQQSGSQQMAAY